MHKPILLAVALAALLAPSLALARSSSFDLQLSCSPAYPVVSLGNSGRFVAVGNVQGPFQWVTPDFGFVDQGPVFVAPMTELGWQQISVVWGSQRATCYVQVVPQPGYGEVTAYSNSFNTPFGVTLSSAFYPFLPNTGYEPTTLAAFAFAFVLLLGSGIALYPHVRKAFTLVIR